MKHEGFNSLIADKGQKEGDEVATDTESASRTGKTRVADTNAGQNICKQIPWHKALAGAGLGSTLVISSPAEWEGQDQPAGGEHSLKYPSKLRKWSECFPKFTERVIPSEEDNEVYM